MAFSFLIAGVEYNCNVFRDTVNIRESLQANGSSLTATIQLSGALTVPTGGQQVKFLRDGNLEFAGRIQSVEHIRPYNANQYRIQCADYTVDLDAKLIQTILESTTAGDQVQRVIALVGRGFTANNVAEGAIVGLQEVDYEYPSAVLSRISESIEHQWYVDYNRDVHFFYVLDRAAPVTSIDFDTNVDDYSNFDFMLDASQVKNVIYLTGAKVKSANRASQGWKADGDTRFFPLGYAPWSLDTTTVRVDNVPKTVKLDSVDSEAGDGGINAAEVYLCLDNWGIRFADGSPPAEDSQVDVSYNYEYEPLIIVENADSIAYMKAIENTAEAPSDGRHELKFNIPDLRVDNEETIIDYGNLLLTRYALPVYTASFESLTQGWQVGQHFRGVSVQRNIDTEFYVVGLNKSIWQSSGGVAKFKYDVEVTSSPFPG